MRSEEFQQRLAALVNTRLHHHEHLLTLQQSVFMFKTGLHHIQHKLTAANAKFEAIIERRPLFIEEEDNVINMHRRAS